MEDFDAGFVLEGEAEGFFVAVYLASSRQLERVTWDGRWGYREEICTLPYAFFA